jgi:hypothetical protein
LIGIASSAVHIGLLVFPALGAPRKRKERARATASTNTKTDFESIEMTAAALRMLRKIAEKYFTNLLLDGALLSISF